MHQCDDFVFGTVVIYQQAELLVSYGIMFNKGGQAMVFDNIHRAHL